MEKWRSYLKLQEFIIYTDQRALSNLMEQRLHTDWQQKAMTKMMGLRYRIVYKKGVENRVADALSRRPHEPSDLLVLSTSQPAWTREIMDSYVGDPFATELIQKLSIDPTAETQFTFHDGVLRKQGCIWVGASQDLQTKLILAFHASSVGGHSGFPVTYRRLKQVFRWKGMKTMTKTTLSQCDTCQLAKPERVPYPGLLQPLRVPSLPWEMMTMDFIEGLPSSGRFNCILVVIDKLTKYGHFIPLKHPFSAHDVADAFVDRVYRLHGFPQSLVSDRDPIFTSKFWQELARLTDIKLCMSSGQHPQTDGQTERVNQQIECFLRCFVSAHPTRWSQWLALCELWYNSNWHSTLGKSPFELVYGHSPRYFGIAPTDAIENQDLRQWMEERQLILDSVRQHSLRAQQRMKVQADKHRTERQFAVGDKVFLKMQPYIQASIAPRANHKLAFKYFGPFDILARVGAVAYKLALPEGCRVHPVFHVSLRKRLKQDVQVQPQLPSPLARMQVPVRFLQRRLINRNNRTVAQALVQWSGLTEELATWEDIEVLKQNFPRASAWGQAVSEDRGIVNNTTRPNSVTQEDNGPGLRPRRTRRAPAWLATGEWAH